MKTKSMLIAMAIIAVSSTTIQAQNTYAMDKNHARLTFSATHFGISHVEGNFKSFEAKLKSSKDDFSDAEIEMTADVKSINTEVEMRDNDLRSANWFEVEKYPAITFKSTSFKKTEGNNYMLTGNITMHGISRPIVFNVTYNGKMTNPMSKKQSVGFTVVGKLNRKDFNIGTEAFAVSVANEVELKSNVEFIEN